MKLASTFIVASLCLITAVNAQPVFTSAQVPTGGSVLTFGSATIPAAFQLNAGPSQTWNFNNVNSDGTLTLEYLSPAMVPAAESVEGCNLVMKTSYDMSPESDYEFNVISNGAWSTLATSTTPDAVEEYYESPDTLFQLPLNAQSDYSTSSYYSSTYYVGAPEMDSSRYVSRSTTRNQVDAWGTLNINGIPYSVLKLRQTSTSVDSTYNYANGVWTFQDTYTSEDVSHMFVSPEAGGIVMVISEYEDEFGQNQWFAFYMLSKSITGISTVTEASDFAMYPNPASSVVTVSCSNLETANHVVTITDISGKLVDSQGLNGNTSAQLDVSNLSKGVYFVRIPGLNTAPKKLIIQ